MKVHSHIYQERRRNRAILIVAIGIFFGLAYPVLSAEFDDPLAFVNGFTIGLIGGLFISGFELYFNNPLNRKIGFISKLISKSLAYTLFFLILIPLVIGVTRSIQSEQAFFAYLFGPEMQNFIFHEDFFLIVLYTLFLSSVIIFTYQISRKMGQNVLWNFITGKYRLPREEERIFMFLDINGSTKIAEKLGDIEFNNLLNDLFYDLTASILSTYGEIYRYVGDQIVVTWKMNRGLKYANCIRTFFQARNTLKSLREKYVEKYGFMPTFSAAYHCGKVIVGEIGDVKSQITFLGDVLYITAQIEKECGNQKKENMVSGALIKRVSLPDIYEMKPCGSLNGKTKNPVDLYTVTEIEMANS